MGCLDRPRLIAIKCYIFATNFIHIDILCFVDKMEAPQAPSGALKMVETESDAPSLNSRRRSAAVAGESSARTTRYTERHLQDRLTRAADLAIAAGLLLLTLPLCGFVCFALKLDSSGSIFSQQPRLSHAGRRYLVLRFMAPETSLGDFLRYTRIEDLPLLINVLRGEMTLMGLYGKPYAFDD